MWVFCPIIPYIVKNIEFITKMYQGHPDKGASINFYGFKTPNNVRIWMGGWVTVKWVFGFQNPLVKKIQDQRIFLLWMFGSLGGWVSHYKSEHCSDF